MVVHYIFISLCPPGIGEIAVAAPVAAQPTATTVVAEPEPVVEEKTIFDVKLVGVDPSMKVRHVIIAVLIWCMGLHGPPSFSKAP